MTTTAGPAGDTPAAVAADGTGISARSAANASGPASGTDQPYRSKTIATWLSFALGSFGAHRVYLHGLQDRWAWAHPLPTLLGIYGVHRMDVLGQDDRLAWLLIPLLGLMIAQGMLAGILTGLTPDDRWNERWNAGLPPRATGWGPVLGVIACLMVGGACLMATIAFSAQRYFESQVEAAREISQ